MEVPYVPTLDTRCHGLTTGGCFGCTCNLSCPAAPQDELASAHDMQLTDALSSSSSATSAPYHEPELSTIHLWPGRLPTRRHLVTALHPEKPVRSSVTRQQDSRTADSLDTGLVVEPDIRTLTPPPGVQVRCVALIVARIAQRAYNVCTNQPASLSS